MASFLLQTAIFQREGQFGFVHDFRVMCGKDEGGAKIITHRLHQIDDAVSGVVIEIGRRLVGQHQARFADQGTGYGNPLSLSAGKLVGALGKR